MPLDKELPLLRKYFRRKFFNHGEEQSNSIPHDINKLQNTRFLRFDRNDHKKNSYRPTLVTPKTKTQKILFQAINTGVKDKIAAPEIIEENMVKTNHACTGGCKHCDSEDHICFAYGHGNVNRIEEIRIC